MMKRIYTLGLLFTLLLININHSYILSQNTTACPNADFSMGDFTNWTLTRGQPNGVPFGGVFPVAGTGNFEIISTPGIDPNVPIQMIPPGYTNSARLNYVNQAFTASRLSYALTVTPQNALFIYNYAIIFGDARNHTPATNPWFSVRVVDANGNLVDPCTQYQESYPGVGYQQSGLNFYRDWVRVGVDLSPYMGQTVTVEFTAASCNAGAVNHWGYAYIVAECQPMEIEVRYCIGDTTAVLVAPDGFDSYVWQPGGHVGQSLTIQNPQPGLSNYTVNLSSNNGQCNAQLNVLIDPVVPNADFDTLTLCQQGAQFTDLSSVNRGSVTQWEWDFGDGDTSTQQHPSHYYSNPGMHVVRLISRTNIGCRDTIERRVYIKPNPIADFSMSGDIVSVTDSNIYCAPGAIFTDLSTHIAPWNDTLSVVSWNWDFGGGNTSTQQNPTFNFPSEGTHTITLIATDNRGCRDTITRTWINNRPPIADFVTPQLCGLTGTFTDQSVDTSPNGAIISWNWNFGDGGTSTTQNPSHTFTGQGTRNVTLVVTDTAGCTDTIVKTFRNNEYPVADFLLPTACGLTQTFVDRSSDPAGEPLIWYWNFVDTIIGNAINQQNPTYTFPSQDSFMVRLIVVDTAGCADTVVQAYQSKESPLANFTYVNVCFGDTMPFTDSSTTAYAMITDWNWSFGDGNTSTLQHPENVYPTDGNFNVQLIVTTDLGCEDTVAKSVLVYPLPVPNFTSTSVCYRKLTDFTNTSMIGMGTIDAYLWHFGSTLVPSNIVNPSVVYPSDGTFNVQLIATSNFGCVDSITLPIIVHPIPDIDFTAGPLVGCYPFNVDFTNNTTINLGNVASYTWTFGDGNTSNMANPSYLYPNADALYTVSLYAISDKGCDTLITKNNYIRVWHKPTADFSYSPSNPNVSDPTIDFTNLSVAADSYQWYFNNGAGSSNLFETSYIYPSDTGWYDAELIAMTVNGCSDTVTKFIHIGPDFIVYVPNTFTPNGDKRNDAFKIAGYGISNSTLIIFNRWGEPLVTLGNNQAIEIGWDGTYNGDIVQQDTYVYKLEIQDLFGKMHTFHGHINVLR